MNGVEIALKFLTKVLSGAVKCDAKLQTELTRGVTGLVMALSTYEGAKHRVVEFGVKPIVKCLHHENRFIKQNAIQVANNACESPHGIYRFVDCLVHEQELLIEVFGAAAIPALSKYLLVAIDEGEKASALKATLALCKKEVRWFAILHGKTDDTQTHSHALNNRKERTEWSRRSICSTISSSLWPRTPMQTCARSQLRCCGRSLGCVISILLAGINCRKKLKKRSSWLCATDQRVATDARRKGAAKTWHRRRRSRPHSCRMIGMKLQLL